MITKDEAIDLAIDEHRCAGAIELMDKIYGSIGRCGDCQHGKQLNMVTVHCNIFNNAHLPSFYCGYFEEEL